MTARERGGLVAGLIGGVVSLLTGDTARLRGRHVAGRRETSGREASAAPAASRGRSGGTATREIDPPARAALQISYAPERDGEPDAGEVVWTWVPYAENDGRGKDRPVLVIGRESGERVFAVRLTSKSHDGDRDFLPIGPGAWDSQGRPSWIDIDQLYSVHHSGMRREAAALDRKRFDAVAQALHRRYGWDVA